MILDQLKQLLAQTHANLEFRTREDHSVFGHDSVRNISESRLCHGEQYQLIGNVGCRLSADSKGGEPILTIAFPKELGKNF